MRTKVAILMPDLRGGGAERVSLALSAEFLKFGYAVDFVLMQAHGELVRLVPEGAGIVDLKVARVRSVIWPLVCYLRRDRPDALLAAMWPLTSMSVVCSRLAGFSGRLLVSEHCVMSKQYQGWGRVHEFLISTSVKLTYPSATARVCVSAGAADDLARLAGLPRSLFTVIYNPIPVHAQVGEVSASATRSGRVPTFLAVGTLKRAKNYPLLLEAFASGPAKNGARLIILGEGEQESELRALAARLAIDHQIEFAGFQIDPSPYYANADVFVLSSDHEGFGNVIVEALSHGVPVVSTDCPSGPAEILQYGRYGRLVPIGDAETLACAMKETLDAEHDPEVLKRRAADFAAEIAAKKYLDLLFPQ